MTPTIAQVLQVLESEALLDELAAAEHERWAHWQRHVHDHCRVNPDGSLTIPAHLVERWIAQISTPYSALSEPEKESDRDQVRRYLPIISKALVKESHER